MSDFFTSVSKALKNTDFDEIPVHIEEFVTSEDYLNLPPLSEYQYTMIKAASQIYRKDTLVELYGPEIGLKRHKQTNTEVVYQIGKGGGKDYTTTISVAYIVYLLLCLKNPARYFGQPDDDNIDILNIAINSDQAKNVFFKGLTTRIKNCKWFEGKYVARNSEIEFDKHVNVYSGHSEREAFEGLNLLVAVLDEIAGFALESTSGHFEAKTADAIYQMYRDSVDSRYPEYGKVVLLSFPRFKGDYIQQRYDAIIVEKQVIKRTHTFVVDPEYPADLPGNSFEIEWEEDHILSYTGPGLFALKRPCWEVNPTKKIEMYTRSFQTNPSNALGKFACMPDSTDGGFMKNHDAIESAFIKMNGVDEDGIFYHDFKPKNDITTYFIHVDLAQQHDRCAIAMAHVEKWVDVNIGANYHEVHPFVVVDAVRWWTPTEDKSVDFRDVINFIKALRRHGFNLKLTTFDRWNSHDTMNELNRDGIKTELLSVAKKHYDDFLSVMYDQRLLGPKIQLLIDELRELKIIKGKVDHPRKGGKDLSDAVCGAIFNAVSHTPKPAAGVVEVHTLKDIRREERETPKGIIVAPRRAPSEIQDYLSRLQLL